MEKNKSEWTLIIKLLIGIGSGVLVGLIANESVMSVVVSAKYILGQLVFYTVPLVIIAFIAPAITKLKLNANKMLGAGIGIAYLSAVGAATFAYVVGGIIIPFLSVPDSLEALKELPEAGFKLNIPPLMSVMSALVLSSGNFAGYFCASDSIKNYHEYIG